MSVIKELLLWLLFILVIMGGLFAYYARTPIPLRVHPETWQQSEKRCASNPAGRGIE
jgi:hypothetical protein